MSGALHGLLEPMVPGWRGHTRSLKSRLLGGGGYGHQGHRQTPQTRDKPIPTPPGAHHCTQVPGLLPEEASKTASDVSGPQLPLATPSAIWKQLLWASAPVRTRPVGGEPVRTSAGSTLAPELRRG